MTKPSVLLNIKWEGLAKEAAFRSVLPDRPILNLAKDMPDRKILDDVRYAVVWKPEHGFLASLPKLEIIFSLGAGVDHVTDDPGLPDVPLVRFVDPNLTGRMVEWVVLQVLMHLRQQRVYDRYQRERRWQEIFPQPAADDIRVGIMGFGELGQASARGLLPLGFKLNAWARSPKQMKGVTCYAGDAELDTFLAQTDVLVSLLPLTWETTGILNRALFEKLARDGPFGAPVVINGGRGGSQVEADIVASLQDKTLHGVSLDVFENEPLSSESPLWGFENAILTPHMAAVSDPDALAAYIAGQIETYEAGGQLENLVDRERGY